MYDIKSKTIFVRIGQQPPPFQIKVKLKTGNVTATGYLDPPEGLLLQHPHRLLLLHPVTTTPSFLPASVLQHSVRLMLRDPLRLLLLHPVRLLLLLPRRCGSSSNIL